MRRANTEPANHCWSRRGFKLVDLIVVIVVVFILAALFVPAIRRVRVAGPRTECLNNLKNIGLAMHNYATTNNGHLPGYAWTNADGEPLHSWVVELLPYLDQAVLSDRWTPDARWDSQVISEAGSSNDSLSNMRIKVLLCPSADSDESGSLLNYVANSGFANRRDGQLHNFDQLGIDWNHDGKTDEADHAIAKDTGAMWLTTEDQAGGLNLNAFEDGAGNTILLSERIEAGQQTWAGPHVDNVAFTYAINPASKSVGTATSDPRGNVTIGDGSSRRPTMLSSKHGDAINIVTADGAARKLAIDIDPDLLRRLITPRGVLHGEAAIAEEEF